jgi:hypothetical protein
MAEMIDTLAMSVSVEKGGNPCFHLKHNAMAPQRPFFLIHQPHGKMTYLIDLNAFDESAFSIPGIETPRTLKSLLESDSFHKVVFDSRMISYTLLKDFGVVLNGVQDLQLMHRLALSTSTNDLNSVPKFGKSFSRCVDDLYKNSSRPQEWKDLKRALLKQKYNYNKPTGSRSRPTLHKTSRVDAQSIQYQVLLKQFCEEKISAKNLGLLESQTLERLQSSRSPDFSVFSKEKNSC